MALLTREEQQALFTLAHGAIERYVLDGIDAYFDPPIDTPALRMPGAAFVTLYVNGQLRGCIGNVRPRLSLTEVVHENALAAATRDPRFPPLTPAEVPALRLEISVLLPAHPDGNPFVVLRDLHEIKIGRDGLFLELIDGRSGLLLPQVAVEHHMNVPQFLNAICQKTGAQQNAWSLPGATLSRFEVQIFGNK